MPSGKPRTVAEHGTVARYSSKVDPCRCDACKAAKAAANAARKGRGEDAKRRREPVKHGTITCYNQGCRREECRAEKNRINNEWAQKNRDKTRGYSAEARRRRRGAATAEPSKRSAPAATDRTVNGTANRSDAQVVPLLSLSVEPRILTAADVELPVDICDFEYAPGKFCARRVPCIRPGHVDSVDVVN